MDYKRNKKYFSPTYKRNLTILGIVSILLAVANYVVWWYIYWSVIFEILLVVFIAMAIASFTMRPKDGYLIDQIDERIEEFRSSTADKLKLPSDFDENSLLTWGFCPGNAEKQVKSELRTDRVCYSLLYLKNRELYIRTRRLGLTAEEESVEEYRLPFDGLKITFSDDEKRLIFTAGEQTVELPIRDKDYNLEQFLEKLAHRQK